MTNISSRTGLSSAHQTEPAAEPLANSDRGGRLAAAITVSADLQTIEENIRQKSDLRLEEQLRSPELPVESLLEKPNLPAPAPGAQTRPVSSEVLLSIIDAEASHLVRKTKELVEVQTELFEHTLARMLSQAFSQADASLQKAAARLETCYAQVTKTEQGVEQDGVPPSH